MNGYGGYAQIHNTRESHKKRYEEQRSNLPVVHVSSVGDEQRRPFARVAVRVPKQGHLELQGPVVVNVAHVAEGLPAVRAAQRLRAHRVVPLQRQLLPGKEK